MGADYRTPEEYAKLFAQQNHKTIEQAKDCIAVRLFEKYFEEREKNETERNG